MGNPSDFYEVLNIPKHSSPEEIRKAYKALVRKWHPDKHPPSSKSEAEARFKAISEAYEALNDKECRTMFGVYKDIEYAGGGSNRGHNTGCAAPCPGPNQRQHRSSEGLLYRNSSTLGRSNITDTYYPTTNTTMASRPAFSSYSNSVRRKPPPVEKKLECTLEELWRGCKKEIKFTKDVIVNNGLIVQKQESQTIRVKPGWKKGTKITFEGMGDERPGCLPADVIYLVSEKEHPIFKRVGNDLVLKVKVPLVNALTGWTFSFRLLSGEKVSCSFNDEIIYPGYEKVIKGQGMPLANEKGVRGDLRIKFHIIFPAQLSAEQRSSITDLLQHTT